MSDNHENICDWRVQIRRCILIVAVTCSLGSTWAQAEEGLGRPNFWSIGVTAGTQGLGGEASYLLYDNLVLRANASYLALNSNATIRSYGGTDQEHDFDITGNFVGGMLDYHPFRSGWRLSAGMRYVDVKFKEVDTDGADIGGTRYTAAAVGTVRTSVHNANSAAPYIGFGYDASHFNANGAGFKLGIDIGALYAGDPDVNITTDKNVPGLAADIANEKASIEDGLDKYYNFYPVLMISGRISF